MTSKIFKESERFVDSLFELIDRPLFTDSDKFIVSDGACGLSFEHWCAVRTLFADGYLPSGVTVHRAQFEALVRSIWVLYCASETNIKKLAVELTLESEQKAKNIPMVAEMMADIEKNAPKNAYDSLARFKAEAWKSLNSYVRAGIHSIRRYQEGYPIALIENILLNANGLAVMSAMQSVMLSGEPSLQHNILALADKFKTCMPTRL